MIQRPSCGYQYLLIPSVLEKTRMKPRVGNRVETCLEKKNHA